MSLIEKCKDIIAQGEKWNSPLYDTALVLDFREAANPDALLPLLRLLVECEEVLEDCTCAIDDIDPRMRYVNAQINRSTLAQARALLAKLRSES